MRTRIKRQTIKIVNIKTAIHSEIEFVYTNISWIETETHVLS